MVNKLKKSFLEYARKNEFKKQINKKNTDSIDVDELDRVNLNSLGGRRSPGVSSSNSKKYKPNPQRKNNTTKNKPTYSIGIR